MSSCGGFFIHLGLHLLLWNIRERKKGSCCHLCYGSCNQTFPPQRLFNCLSVVVNESLSLWWSSFYRNGDGCLDENVGSTAAHLSELQLWNIRTSHGVNVCVCVCEMWCNKILCLILTGDFGVSCLLMGSCDLATTFTGTPYYMSPEVLGHRGYDSKSDMWWVERRPCSWSLIWGSAITSLHVPWNVSWKNHVVTLKPGSHTWLWTWCYQHHA